MFVSFLLGLRVTLLKVLSTVILVWFTLASTAAAHEVVPAIADMETDGATLTFSVRLNVESFIAGIDQSTVTDTNQSAQADEFDALRALEPDALETAFVAYWPQMAEGIAINAGDMRLPLTLNDIMIPDVGNVENARTSILSFSAALPAGTETVSFGWAPEFGTLVLRQMGVTDPYDGFLMGGSRTPSINLDGGN